MTAGARTSASGNAHDAAATASTLNYALGRKHMKSWMTGRVNGSAAALPNLTLNSPPSIVEKRGGSRKYPPPDTNNQQHATQTVSPTPNAPSAERLPASNSTSPQLANIVTTSQRNPSHSNAEVTVLPSPTPSEENATNAELQASETGIRQRVNIDDFDISPQVPNALGIIPAAIHSAPKRPAHLEETPVEKRARIDSTMQEPPRAVASASSAASPVQQLPQFLQFPEFSQRPSVPHAQHASPSLGHVPSRSPSLGRTLNGPIVSPQLVQTAQHLDRPPSSLSNPSPVQSQHICSPPARQTQVNPPLNSQPSRFLPNVHAQQTMQLHHLLSSQRRASYHDDWYSHDTCLQMVTNFKAANAAAPSSATIRRRDGERLQVLEEAVRERDWAYLTLHQYYCLMTHFPRTLPPSLTLRCGTQLYSAQSLMREVLDDNSHLSASCMNFFCTFPYPVDYLASTWPMRFQHAERDFVEFVKYSPHVGQLRHVAEVRKIPPTPREFAKCAITSLTFQRLLLRSIIRSLWVGYPQVLEKRRFEDRVLQAFNHAHSVFDQSRFMGQLRGRQEADDELQAWTFTFTEITVAFEATLQNLGFQRINPSSARMQLQQQQPQLYNTPAATETAMPHRRQQPLPQAIPHQTASQTHPSPQLRKITTALLPRPGLIQPQQRVPNPSRFGLHQAHLRSPVLQASALLPPVFYFWQGFVRRPQRLKDPNHAIAKLSFKFSDKEMEFVAKAVTTAPGAPTGRAVDENHKLIRLRCVKWPSNEEPKDDAWATTDNSWIPHSYFTFNDTPLQLRKKLHYGKDLPVDLTGLVRGGENVLEVSVMSNSSETVHRNYLVAIEFLGIMTKAAIKDRVQKKSIPATKMINDIKWKLSPHDSDDDDIAIVESTLTINLRDPFSASKICDTPVRGTACLHNECFDLDTFLETRPRKGDVSAADHWRCPICRADARPNVLAVDEFLGEVRKELEKQGLLETRAIIVDQDGSWKPKPQERDPNGVHDRNTPESTPTAAPIAPKSNPSFVHEIIDLDSD